MAPAPTLVVGGPAQLPDECPDSECEKKGLGELTAALPADGRHVEQLERDKEALLNHYARIVPEQLDTLEPEERNRVYKMLDLTVLAHENGNLELTWALGADPCRDNEPPPRWSFAYTTPAFRFRAVLTDDGSEEVELARA